MLLITMESVLKFHWVGTIKLTSGVNHQIAIYRHICVYIVNPKRNKEIQKSTYHNVHLDVPNHCAKYNGILIGSPLKVPWETKRPLRRQKGHMGDKKAT